MRWVMVLLAALLISMFVYVVHPYARVERRIYYYSNNLGRLALETHRVNWIWSAEQSACTTVVEQLQPPYSYDAASLFTSFKLNTCLLRNGSLYVDLAHDWEAPVAVDDEGAIDPLAVLRRSLRLNHHFIRRILISVNGLPYP